MLHSQAEAGSPPPSAPTAPGRNDNTQRSAASPGRWGRTACNWLHREPRSSRHSLEKTIRTHGRFVKIKRETLESQFCSYIYSMKTEGSGTWWQQTFPQRTLRRWVSAAPRISLYISAHQGRDLRAEENNILLHISSMLK